MAFRSIGTVGTGASKSLSCSAPSGVVAGDILIMIAAVDGGSDSYLASWSASGWTAFTTQVHTSAPDGQNAMAWWKVATGSDTYTATLTWDASMSTTPDWIMAALAFSGRNATGTAWATPATNTSSNANPVSINAPTITAVAGDDLVWASIPDVTASGIGNGHAAPTNYTERLDAENAWSNLAVDTRDNVSAGATGTVSANFTVTSTGAGWIAFHIRIPAGAVFSASNSYRRHWV
jgi:hypothetical protein